MTLSVYVIEDREDWAARVLEAALAAGLNVLVSGGAQAGNPTDSQDTRKRSTCCCPTQHASRV